MDLQSILGYAHGSPFSNSPYLDIKTPEGLITMADTPIDLLGIDNMGNVKKMKAGRKNPYKFQGTNVREIPMQTGGRPPINVTNPNDPRIKAYMDSLSDYEHGQQMLIKEGAINNPLVTPNQAGATYGKRIGFTTKDALSHLEKGIRQEDMPIGYRETPYGYFRPQFQKPVQPVQYSPAGTQTGHPVYTPDRNIANTDVAGVPNSQLGQINEQAYHPLDLSQKPTKYSLTYRDENSPSKQSTVYFNTIEQWRAAVNSGFYKPVSTSETSDSATAAGYKMQTGGEVSQVKQFYDDYLNSPKYVERLKGMGYTNPQQTKDERLQNMQNVTVSHVLGDSSRYVRDKNNINFDADERRQYGISKFGNASHEFSHVLGAVGFTGMTLRGNQYLNPNEINALDQGNRKIQQSTDPHDWHAGETKADMDAFRFLLKNKGIYDTGTQNFNPEFLKKARQNKEIIGDFNAKRFLDKYSDEDIVRLMNTVAQNSSSDNSYMKKGGRLNPYQQGGMNSKQLFDFLFDEEDPETPAPNTPSAPSTEEVDVQSQMTDLEIQKRQMENQQNDELAMSMITDSGRGNPYGRRQIQPQSGNPYTGPIESSGEFGDQNVGDFGRQIYGHLTSDLGYTPVANSIYRSKQQNDALIAAGKPAVPNSWHLTGNAIDLKPADWHRLTNEQQQFYRMNYDVITHNGHYHIEPK